VLPDNKDRLWLLCGENRVGYFNTSDFSFHEVQVQFDKKFLKTATANIYQDWNGNIMLMLAWGAFLTYNEAEDRFTEKATPFPMPPHWKPHSLFCDTVRQTYWIAADSGLAKYNPQNKTLSYRDHNADRDEAIKAYEQIRFMSQPMMDKQGRLWAFSWHPRGPGPFLYSYDAHAGKLTEWEQKLTLTSNTYHEIHGIKQLSDGRVWITGKNLMAYLSETEDNFQFIQPDKGGEFSIRYDAVNGLSEDKEMNIWVSTDKGLFRFNPTAQLFHIIPNKRPGKDSAYTPDVTGILQTKRGEILVSTWGNGVFGYDSKFNPIRLNYVEESRKSLEGLTWCILQRTNGDIWRGNQDGILFITYAATGKTVKLVDPIFRHGTIRQIVEDRDGNLWLGGHGGLLVKWTAATSSFRLVHHIGTIFRLFVDDRGMLWAATGGTGLYRFKPATGEIIAHYTSDAPINKRLMAASAVDVTQHNDSIFLAAAECLNIINIKTGEIKHFSADNGLPSNTVNNLINDQNGFLWLTTDNRICRYNIDKSVLSTFNEEDGLPASGFSFPASTLLQDGRIAIGRVHDLIVFDPGTVTPENIIAPQIEITGFLLMNERLAMDSLRKLSDVSLRHNQNSIIIQFSTLTYLNHFATEYMLEGMDKKWIATYGVNEANYNYLPPGNYTFKVRSLSGDDQYSEIATIHISVRTPFWKSWWFYTLLALLLVALFYWEDRERLRRKEALQKMRSDIAGNLHEEINLALNNINVLSEIARIKADKDPEESKTYINDIHHKSHNMIIAMDDMLWSIDPANDSMAKVIDRIKEFADALRHRHNVLIHLHTDQKVLSLRPIMKVRHETMIIHKFALRLLIEELKAPQTSIQIDYVRSQLQITIFSHHVKMQDLSNQGTKIIEEMKKRAASISALLEFQSDEKGTGIILVVKT
jgi:ligand-binding sensor domain-containing protein